MGNFISRMVDHANFNPADLILEIELRSLAYIGQPSADKLKDEMFRRNVGGNYGEIDYKAFFKMHVGSAKISEKRQKLLSDDDCKWIKDLGLGGFLSEDKKK